MDKRTVFFLLLFVKSSLLLSNNLRIGGLFEVSDSVEEVAFRHAVDTINNNNKVLPRSRLVASIERLPSQNSFYAANKACDSLKLGVAALFGPTSPTPAGHVQSICNAKEIPHIETREDSTKPGTKHDYGVNLHPYPTALSKAYVSLVLALGWKDMVVLYEDSEGLAKLQELLKLSGQGEAIKVNIKQILPGPGKDYRPLMKDLKQSGVSNIVLDCATENIAHIFKHAQQVGMMTAYNNYIITNLDLDLVDLEDFKYSGTSITSMRLVDPNDKKVKEVVREWTNGGTGKFGAKSIPTEAALLYDAVLLFAQALNDLSQAQNIETAALTCNGEDTWHHGKALINYIKVTELEGLSGQIKLDPYGRRVDFSLDIVQLKEEGLVRVGNWDERTRGKRGANLDRNETQQLANIQQSFRNKTLKIVTILNEPYTMKRWYNGNVVPDQYEGFNIDLVKVLSKEVKFKYTIELVKDGKYGRKTKSTGKWDGLMGQIQQKGADLGVADLTMTSEREQAVDFSLPYMNLGITMLSRVPTKKEPNQLAFLSPLTSSVWLYMIAAYCLVSVLLYLLAKLSPYEKSSLCGSRCHSDDTGAGQDEAAEGDAKQSQVQEPTFTLMNSFWFVFASLFTQKVEITPRAHSTRFITGFWWLFTLLMVASYTANLAAFLTTERMEFPIESVHDLASQRKIKYGVIKGGSTEDFFKNSELDIYGRMWNNMDQNPSFSVGSTKEGIDRVKDGEFVLMAESTMVEYVTGRNCELMQIGGLLDSKTYGIALPKNSPLRAPINRAILRLQEQGVLARLKRKWWKQQRGGGMCVMDYVSSSVGVLGQDNVGGIFVFLLVGLLLSIVIAIIEFCWQYYRTRKAEQMFRA